MVVLSTYPRSFRPTTPADDAAACCWRSRFAIPTDPLGRPRGRTTLASTIGTTLILGFEAGFGVVETASARSTAISIDFFGLPFALAFGFGAGGSLFFFAFNILFWTFFLSCFSASCRVGKIAGGTVSSEAGRTGSCDG